jgi:hypothetical protein
MVQADGAFHEGECLPAKWDGLAEFPLGPSRDGQIVEADGFVKRVKSSILYASLLARLRR